MTADQSKLFTQLRDDVQEIKFALVGNPEMKTEGAMQRLKSIEDKMIAHEALDNKNFTALFNFQENQKLLIGWSRWTIGLICSGLVMFGGLVSWAVTTIIAILK